jgi:hypothetical protein
MENIESLVGKTISSIALVGCKNKGFMDNKECDGMGTLEVSFSDGYSIEIISGYGGYTGDSCDEYPEFLIIREVSDIETTI